MFDPHHDERLGWLAAMIAGPKSEDKGQPDQRNEYNGHANTIRHSDFRIQFFMKTKPFTIVATCLCGCDNVEVYHTRAKTGELAAQKVKDQVRIAAALKTQTRCELNVHAVFRGHLRNQHSD